MRDDSNAKHVCIQLGVVLATAILAWFIAPTIDTQEQHAAFVEFFSASAAVIAALLIALAIEARSVNRSTFYAWVTMGSVAIAAVSAVAALSPSLPEWWIYRWLFVFTVAGGSGALSAVMHASAQLIQKDARETQTNMLNQFADRRKRDEEARRAKACRVDGEQ